jgi:3-carboxy-cis,cis-muconate cycloisomerase
MKRPMGIDMPGGEQAPSSGSSSLLGVLTGDEKIALLFGDEADIAAMLRFEAALAESEADAGLISRVAAARIAAVCADFAPDWPALAAGIAADGVAVPTLVRQLRMAVGEPHAIVVHLGATSQDAIDTSLVLRLVAVLDLLEGRLRELVTRLDKLAAGQGSIPLMGRTRMQQALPFTAADKIRTWTAPLRRNLQRLAELRPRLLVVQLGGPVGTRDGLNSKGEDVTAGLARRLGLAPAPSWHSQRDGIAELGSFLSLVSGSLGKFGEDVVLLAQNEVGQVVLAGGGGSSAMPHKSNPVTAEVLVALARFNAGLTGALHQALVHENERSGAAWAIEWLTLPRMAEATGAGLRLAFDLAGRIDFRPSAAIGS